MSLHIAFLQRTPLILAATLVLFAAQSSVDHSEPAAGIWERPVNLEFGTVSFAEAQAQPMSQQADVQAVTLPFVSQTAPDAGSRAAIPRWVF